MLYRGQQMASLFLDANSYLNFYSLSPADIKELGKLVELIELKKLTLYIPDQVRDEVHRNREKVIAQLISPVREGRVQVPLPPFLTKHPDAEALKKTLADTQKAHGKLVKELQEAARDERFPADDLIKSLLQLGKRLKYPEAFARASQRKALGRPPGKGSSLGDAVNWETLLHEAPDFADLSFVSADGDFSSSLNDSQMDSYLLEEWGNTKQSTLDYFRDIKAFLEAKYPAIHLTSDVRKYFLIESLVASGSFSSTHAYVAELSQYVSFTLSEATRLLSEGLENSQIRWLAQDDDVMALLKKVMNPHRAALPKKLVAKWDYLMSDQAPAYGPTPSDERVAGAQDGTTDLG